MLSKILNSMNIAEAKRTIQQLRIEANVERIKVNLSHIAIGNLLFHDVTIKYFHFIYLKEFYYAFYIFYLLWCVMLLFVNEKKMTKHNIHVTVFRI